MDDKGHGSHTAPVYVIVDKKLVRASAEDAQYFITWIDNVLAKIAPGGPWSSYFTHDQDVVEARYKKAKSIYVKILAESKSVNP